ncbi:efflux RND transporter permease subunit [Thalassoroseus pseudoceratinae]|uniref:efflux RND transporter permease subunit n=1 Tax=Thalassoroseus pseudoceratinae TaxID=2713176 RepID=UPI0014221A82|nr:MMPL family transporter [Thalassoroseus pseudoceratinae]
MSTPPNEETSSKPLRMRLAATLVRWRGILLPIAIVLLGLGWWIGRNLEFDRRIESLYASDDPVLRDYSESKALFGGDEFVIIAFDEPELLDEFGNLSDQARNRLDEFRSRLHDIPGISTSSTQDLASASAPQTIEIDLSTVPGLLKSFVENALKDFELPQGILHDLMRGVLIGRNDETTALVLRLQPETEAAIPRAETIARIRAVTESFGTEFDREMFVVGEPVQVLDMFRYVEDDGQILFTVSLVLLALVLLILLRSVRWVALPVLIVVVTIAWTQAILVLSDARLSMVSSMLNSLVTIIGVATVMHLAVHFRDQGEVDPESALRNTLAAKLSPIMWTCLTTAAGFAALLASQITPVSSFGMMMTLATVLVLFAVATTLPGGVLLGKPRHAAPRGVSGQRLSARLTVATDWTIRHRIRVLIAFAVITVFCSLGFLRLQVETDFSKNFRDDSPIVRGLNFAETPDRLGGAGTWEVNFPAPSELSEAFVERVEKLTKRLRDEFTKDDGTGEISKVLSVSDGVNAVPKRPFVTQNFERQLTVLKQVQPEFLPSLYNPEAGRMRIVLRAPERQPAGAKLDLIRRVRDVSQTWVDEELGEQFPQAKAKTTGLFVLLAFLIQSLLSDQVTSFVLAVIGIGLMMLLAFRDWRTALVAVAPNIFPIIFVIGVMGWLGVPINIATAMIASVSIGLTVDSSIHYIFGYRIARAAGLSCEAALRETHASVGRALVYANLALIAGFSVLTLSHFIPLVYFGILVSLAMLGGLAGNLLLLPVLLGWTDREVA